MGGTQEYAQEYRCSKIYITSEDNQQEREEASGEGQDQQEDCCLHRQRCLVARTIRHLVTDGDLDQQLSSVHRDRRAQHHREAKRHHEDCQRREQGAQDHSSY